MKMRPLSTLKGLGPVLIYGRLETELCDREDEPSWHVCEGNGHGLWYVTGTCYYSAWISEPLGWAPLPTV